MLWHNWMLYQGHVLLAALYSAAHVQVQLHALCVVPTFAGV
jgi:hypothetical protein